MNIKIEDIIESDIAQNEVLLEGYINSEPEYHHTTHDEKIYDFILEVPRLNKEVSDYIPIEVSERTIDIDTLTINSPIKVTGQFRSYNKPTEDGKRVALRLFVFVKDIEFIDSVVSTNNILLDGHICKEPRFRTTPGGREICDMILAVQRVYGRSDYIPCILWSRNARYGSKLPVGTRVFIEGRIQSRQYKKRLDDNGNWEWRTAYEVSTSRIGMIEENKVEEDNIQE